MPLLMLLALPFAAVHLDGLSFGIIAIGILSALALDAGESERKGHTRQESLSCRNADATR